MFLYTGEENRQEGRQVDRRHLQAWFGVRQFYPSCWYPAAQGSGTLPLETDQLHHRGENRAQNCLTVSNIKLDDVFSDVFGEAASAITDRLLENNEPFDVTPYLTKCIKAPVEKIQAAVDGKMCVEQAEKLRIIRSHMDALELCKLNLQSLILTTAEKYLPQLNIVATAPGIQAFSAIGVISEIGVDMSVFPSSKHLCSWAGLTPQNNESAGKKKTTRISRAGAYIKPLLVQCALCAFLRYGA